MKNILFFILIYTCSYGQEFAIIQDTDGYTNVREHANTLSKTITKLVNNHLVFIVDTEGNWVNIDFALTKTNDFNTGYIYHNRCKPLSEFELIPTTTVSKEGIIHENSMVKVIITLKDFEKQKHNYQYVKNTDDLVLKIDGENYWGTDGNFPTTEYKSIEISFNNTSYFLPKEALIGLYEPNFYHCKSYLDTNENILYITSFNSDGAGGYNVVWKIQNGKYTERYITHGF